MHRWTSRIWLGFCLLVLILTLRYRDTPAADSFVVYAMSALSFPAGALLAWVATLIGEMLRESYSIAIPGGLIHNLVVWAVGTALGYAQWFVLLPRTLHRIRARRQKRPRP